MSKKRLGIFVVALIVIVLLGIGYFYTEGTQGSTNTVLVAVRGYLSVEQKDALTAQLDGYAPTEGLPVTLRVLEFPAASGAEMPSAELSQKMGELSSAMDTGEMNLLLLDRFVFDLLGDERLFEDLAARYPTDAAVSGKYLYTVAGTSFGTANGLQDMPELYLALRNGQSASVNKNAKTLKYYAIQSELLDNIAQDTPLDGYAAVGLKK